jgi:hypothetical protein
LTLRWYFLLRSVFTLRLLRPLSPEAHLLFLFGRETLASFDKLTFLLHVIWNVCVPILLDAQEVLILRSDVLFKILFLFVASWLLLC